MRRPAVRGSASSRLLSAILAMVALGAAAPAVVGSGATPGVGDRVEAPVTTSVREIAEAMLRHEVLPDPNGLVEAVGVAADAVADGDWKAMHAFVKSHGATLNAVRAERARRYMQSAPPEHRKPGLEAMTDQQIAELFNKPVTALKSVDLKACAVMRVGRKQAVSAGDLLMAPPATRTPNRRRFAGERQLLFPHLHTPPDVDVDASPEGEAVIVELPGQARDGPTLIVVAFAHFETCGWLPVATLMTGELHRPPL